MPEKRTVERREKRRAQVKHTPPRLGGYEPVERCPGSPCATRSSTPSSMAASLGRETSMVLFALPETPRRTLWSVLAPALDLVVCVHTKDRIAVTYVLGVSQEYVRPTRRAG
jgi:hypothetical protein